LKKESNFGFKGSLADKTTHCEKCKKIENLWIWIVIMAFFVGTLVSAKYYQIQTNTAISEAIDELVETPLFGQCYKEDANLTKLDPLIQKKLENLTLPKLNSG